MSGSGLPEQELHRAPGAGPVDGCKDDWGPGAHHLGDRLRELLLFSLHKDG